MPKRMTNSDTVPEPEMPRPQPKNLQSLRAVYKNSLSAPTPRPSITGTNVLLAESEIVYIDCFTEQATGMKAFLWECVLLAFEDALHVRHNSRILPFLRDRDDQLIKPIRIEAMPDVVLDVVIRDLATFVPPSRQSTGVTTLRAHTPPPLPLETGAPWPTYPDDRDDDFIDLSDKVFFNDDDSVISTATVATATATTDTTVTRPSTSTSPDISQDLGSINNNRITSTSATTITFGNRASTSTATSNTTIDNSTSSSNGISNTPRRATLSLQPNSPPLAPTSVTHNVTSGSISSNNTTNTNSMATVNTANWATFADDYDYENNYIWDDDFEVDDDDDGWEISMNDWASNINEISPISFSSSSTLEHRSLPATQSISSRATVITTGVTPHRFATATPSHRSLQRLEPVVQGQRTLSPVHTTSTTLRPYSWGNYNNTNTDTHNSLSSRRFTTNISSTTATTGARPPRRPPMVAQDSQRYQQWRQPGVPSTVRVPLDSWSDATRVNASNSIHAQCSWGINGAYYNYNITNRNHNNAAFNTTATTATTTATPTAAIRAATSGTTTRRIDNDNSSFYTSTTRPHAAAINTNTSTNWTLGRNGWRYPTTAPDAQRSVYPPEDVIEYARRNSSSLSSSSSMTRTTAAIPTPNTSTSTSFSSLSSSSTSLPTTSMATATNIPVTATSTATTTTTAANVIIPPTTTTATTPPYPLPPSSASAQAPLDIENLIVSAESGDPTSQLRLASVYRDGTHGVPKDYYFARKWFLALSENTPIPQQQQQHETASEAMYQIALMYENGQPGRPDFKEAREWYFKAAEKGHTWAQLKLGDLYYKGAEQQVGGGGEGEVWEKVVVKNTDMALEWYLRAAKKGDAEAQWKVGKVYLEGYDVDVEGSRDEGRNNVSRDRAKGLEWCRRAATQRYANAGRTLVENGIVVFQAVRDF